MTENRHLIACHDCDLLHRLPQAGRDSRVLCNRCGAILQRNRIRMVSRTLPLVIGGLILFVLANCFPFMSLNTRGLQQDTIFISGVFQLFHQQLWGLGTIVVLSTLLIPLTQLLALSYLLVGLSCDKKPPAGVPVLKYFTLTKPWGMLDVYMLGVLIGLVKLLKIATVIPGIALYSFAGLILVQVTLEIVFDQQELWERIAR
ncbi:MAG: paraquat-inducible protein A [Desulfuromonadales bacterium]|nr:paraquat-inducible protein A [Desulfuromonadales bacterium]